MVINIISNKSKLYTLDIITVKLICLRIYLDYSDIV